MRVLPRTMARRRHKKFQEAVGTAPARARKGGQPAECLAGLHDSMRTICSLFLNVLGMMLGELDGSSQTPAKSKPVRLCAVLRYCYMSQAAHMPQAMN